MASMIDGVDQRTRLVGRNRLELLLFRLGTRQRYGINVFKVREVIRCPALTRVPRSHPVVRGIASMRGNTISVLDLSLAIGMNPLQQVAEGYVIVTEFNRTVQGFLVGSVDRIFNTNWEDVMPPPRGTGRHNYMTAVTSVDGELVELIDVEKVLSEVQGIRSEVSAAVAAAAVPTDEPGLVLVVDDSMVARKQVARTLEQIGIPFQLANDGRQAAELLKSWAADPGPPVAQRVPMVISDIEMPEMDGYTLTKTIKDDPRLAGIYVLLHTSLSGVFNHVMVEKVGADRFVPKFNPDELAGAVLQRMRGGAVPARAAAG